MATGGAGDPLVECSVALKDRVHFRGQSNREWKLQPTIGRLSSIHHAGESVPEHNLELQEQLLLHRFRRYAYPHHGRILNDWETLFLARHHALPVRLVDWTSNPLVALFFACEYAREEDNRDGAIVTLQPPELILRFSAGSRESRACSPRPRSSIPPSSRPSGPAP